MQENYLISIIGRQRTEDQTDEIRLTTLGTYRKRDGMRFIAYKEYEENTKKPRTSVLKVEEATGRVTLTRAGGDSTRLILEEGKRHLCQYSTDYGNMMVGIFTSSVKSNLTDEGGDLKVSYTLDINSDLSSMNEISITVKEAGNKNVKGS